MNATGISGIVLLVIAVAQAAVDYTKLKNHGIHTFQNRHDGGYLTAINLRTPDAPIVSDVWRDAPTQKWRVKSALTSVSYQIYPISADEERVVYYDVSKGIVYQDKPGMGLTSKQYWQPLYIGQGYHIIKSYENSRCLESRGTGQPVGVAECNNAPRQQWAIHSL